MASKPNASGASLHISDERQSPVAHTSDEARETAEEPTLNEAGSGRRPLPLLKRIKPALVLENSGSVARDHLASERTFLAYVRTSLAIAATGVGKQRPYMIVHKFAYGL
jgi:hypothetical protein